MKTLIVFLFLIITNFCSTWAQNANQNIVKRNKDTVYCKIQEDYIKGIVCLIDSQKATFAALDINGYYDGKDYYGSGLFRSKWGNDWVFVQRVVGGKMNLYVKGFTDPKVGSSYETVSGVSYYVRLEDNQYDEMQKLGAFWRRKLKRVGANCPKFVHKIKHTKYWQGDGFEDEINYYNTECK